MRDFVNKVTITMQNHRAFAQPTHTRTRFQGFSRELISRREPFENISSRTTEIETISDNDCRVSDDARGRSGTTTFSSDFAIIPQFGGPTHTISSEYRRRSRKSKFFFLNLQLHSPQRSLQRFSSLMTCRGSGIFSRLTTLPKSLLTKPANQLEPGLRVS